MTHKKKLLHIQKVKGISGSEKHLHHLLTHLDNEKYEIHYIILEEPSLPQQEYAAMFNGSAVRVYQWPIRFNFDPFLLRKLKKYIRQEHFDLVHTHLIHADIHGALAAHRAGVQDIVSTKHGVPVYEKMNFLHLFLLRYSSKYLSRVITISDALQKYLVQYERIPQEKMQTIHYSLKPPAIVPDQEPQTDFLFLGRLREDKGCWELIKAFEQVIKKIPETRLWIAGDGPLKSEMEKIVSEKQLANSIKILGYQRDIDDLMGKTKVLVLPSYGEGFGLVLLEAMAHQKPVIATNVSAIPEIVLHGKTGLLVPPRNVHSLAEAMITLQKDSDLRGQLGQAGFERLKKFFSPELMVSKTEALYNKLWNRD